MGLIRGQRPDITPVQVTAMAVAGLPIVSKLLAAYGVYSPSPEQLSALTDATGWAVGAAAALVLGDAGVRAARNAKDGRVESAILARTDGPPSAPDELGIDLPLDEDLPSDEEEFASPLPDESNVPVQPSQTGLAP